MSWKDTSLKVGDKVRVKFPLEIPRTEDVADCGYMSGMDRLAGNIMTVDYIYKTVNNRLRIRLRNDPGQWNWSEEMVERI